MQAISNNNDKTFTCSACGSIEWEPDGQGGQYCNGCGETGTETTDDNACRGCGKAIAYPATHCGNECHKRDVTRLDFGVDIPAQINDAIAAGHLTDQTWHNDMSPSFHTGQMIDADGDTFALCIWLNGDEARDTYGHDIGSCCVEVLDDEGAHTGCVLDDGHHGEAMTVEQALALAASIVARNEGNGRGGGSGTDEPEPRTTACGECEGEGKVERFKHDPSRLDGYMAESWTEDCEPCDGSGLVDVKCDTCDVTLTEADDRDNDGRICNACIAAFEGE